MITRTGTLVAANAARFGARHKDSAPDPTAGLIYAAILGLFMIAALYLPS